VEHNCTDINKAQFSYNNAVYLLGAAYMYNYVSSPSSVPLLQCSSSDYSFGNRPTAAMSGSSARRTS
jgi:glycosyl hydrolase family 76